MKIYPTLFRVIFVMLHISIPRWVTVWRKTTSLPGIRAWQATAQLKNKSTAMETVSPSTLTAVVSTSSDQLTSSFGGEFNQTLNSTSSSQSSISNSTDRGPAAGANVILADYYLKIIYLTIGMFLVFSCFSIIPSQLISLCTVWSENVRP